MVGDSGTDIETARAAGMPVVAVTFGYTPVPVATFGPDRLIDHFDAAVGRGGQSRAVFGRRLALTAVPPVP